MKTQIVVVGGGAGGLELVRRLGARLGRKDFDIILVERNHTHVWKPLLHEVAAVQRSRGLALCQRWDAFARISASAM
jgi:NADH dehydrogenase FAD-containing subunit